MQMLNTLTFKEDCGMSDVLWLQIHKKKRLGWIEGWSESRWVKNALKEHKTDKRYHNKRKIVTLQKQVMDEAKKNLPKKKMDWIWSNTLVLDEEMKGLRSERD